MRLLADEGVEVQIVEALRGASHEVAYIAELAPGITDDEVMEEARRTESILLTTDRDFGDLVYRQHRATCGVVLLRLAGLPSERKAPAVLATIEQHADELPGCFTVVTPKTVRLRRL